MKDLGILKLALLYAGCFLGAGYVSGQEIWQYFGAFGINGYIGLFLTMVLLFILGVIILKIARMKNITEADKVISPWHSPILRFCISALEIIMMFSVIGIMAAGVGALFEQIFSIPHYIGSAVFCVLILICALAGLKGIVSAFGVSVPVLVIATVIFGVISLIQKGIPADMFAVRDTDNSLLGSWVFSCINFASYNIFATVALLTPFSKFIKSRRTENLGIGLGTVALFLIALSVMAAVSMWSGASDTELPMLFVASELGYVPMIIYALLLFAAMFGTSLSNFVSLSNFLAMKSKPLGRHKKLMNIVLCVLVFLASLFGFGDLISVLYPIFGYLSAIFVVLMLIHYFILRSKQKKKTE